MDRSERYEHVLARATQACNEAHDAKSNQRNTNYRHIGERDARARKSANTFNLDNIDREHERKCQER